MTVLNQPRLVNHRRGRATAAEMEERAEFLIAYANAHGPISVRGLYYAAEVAGVPGIDKSDLAYGRVVAQVLTLRRNGRLSYHLISDATRYAIKPTSYLNPQDAIIGLTENYRKALWTDTKVFLEVWLEKRALIGAIYPITAKYDVPLMPAGGFTSETFAFNAVEDRGDDTRRYVVLYFGDFDRAGQDCARILERKLRRFAEDKGIPVEFHNVAVTLEQIEAWNLPTREHKRKSKADQNWPYDFACELDAITPEDLRILVEKSINRYMPKKRLMALLEEEAAERAQLQHWARRKR
jgi:hypothetical protein